MDVYAYMFPLIPNKILHNEGKRYKCDQNTELDELNTNSRKQSTLNNVEKSIHRIKF